MQNQALGEIGARLAEILIDRDFQATLLGGLILALFGLAFRLFSPKAKLVWSISHQFSFNTQPLPGQPLILHTRTLFVQNVGRAAATGVEIVLNFQPSHFQLWPVFNFTTLVNPVGNFTIGLANLAARELFTVEILQTSPGPNHVALPDVLRVRSAAGEAKAVRMVPMRAFPAWVNFCLAGLCGIGLLWILKTLVLAAFN